jgi:hypothetical protein
MNTDISCAWCNASDQVYVMKVIPDRWGHNKFCRNRPCTTRYDNFVAARDLSFGLPYHLKERVSSNRRCDFCGIIGEDDTIINLPFEGIEHFTFCRSSICYRAYLKFMRANPNSIACLISKIPYVFRDEAIEKLTEMKTVIEDMNNELEYKRSLFKTQK